MAVQQWSPTDNQVTMTDAALKHLHRQIAKVQHGVGMRLGIKKSGCSGYAYAIDIIDKSNSDDHIYQVSDDYIVAVAPQHLPFVQGTQIDYIKDGINHRFEFNNPNEANSCGCGESFTVIATED